MRGAISKARAVTGVLTLGFVPAVALKCSRLHLPYPLRYVANPAFHSEGSQRAF